MIQAEIKLTAISRQSQLTMRLWFLRLSCLWLPAFPIYFQLTDSPLLHGPSTDLAVFQPGGELLVALLDGLTTRIGGLAVATLLLGLVASLVAWVGSIHAWVACVEPGAVFSRPLWSRTIAVIPRAALFSFAGIATVLTLGCLWRLCFPVIGGLLLPRLGERSTDLVQLLIVCMVGTVIAVALLLTDVGRALVIRRDTPARDAANLAVALCRAAALRLALQAGLRLALAASLQFANVWAITHWYWLARSPAWSLLAFTTTESAAVAAIWLRLDWIVWICQWSSASDRNVDGQVARLAADQPLVDLQ